MTTHQYVQRDERTVAVENISYRWSFNFLIYALLIDVVYRAAVRNEAAWDLLALAIVPGIACGIYQARQRILPRGWLWKMTLLCFVVGVISAVVAAILAMTKGI